MGTSAQKNATYQPSASFEIVTVFLYRRAVVRWEGLLLIGHYALYITYLALVALRDPMEPTFAAIVTK
jgi:hypothetical protein